jgi:hypothetical protein
MNITFKSVIILILILPSISIFGQFNFQIDEIKFYNVNEKDNPNNVDEGGCIGPGILLEGIVKNISSDELSISTLDSYFHFLYSFQNENYAEELVIFAYGGLQDSLSFEPGQEYKVSITSKTAFVESIFSQTKKDYSDEIEKIIPTIKVLYFQEFPQNDRATNIRLFVSQDVSPEKIKVAIYE